MFYHLCPAGNQDQASEVQDGAPISKHPREYIHNAEFYNEGVEIHRSEKDEYSATFYLSTGKPLETL